MQPKTFGEHFVLKTVGEIRKAKIYVQLKLFVRYAIPWNHHHHHRSSWNVVKSRPTIRFFSLTKAPEHDYVYPFGAFVS